MGRCGRADAQPSRVAGAYSGPGIYAALALVTYMFVHADFGHFIFNMWGMMIFGPILERAVGRSRVLSAYLICGLLGAAIWYVFNMKSYANLMGASAAVVGYLVAAAVLFPDERMRLLFPPIDVSLKTLAIVFVGIDVLMLFNTGGRVAHLAHLGGAVGGLLMFRSVLLQRASQASRRRKFAPKSLHVCATCGVTDAKNPQLDFRVCSSCAGSEEYCEAHLRSHEHTLEKTDG